MENDTYFLINTPPTHEFYSPNVYHPTKSKKSFTNSVKYSNDYRTEQQNSPGRILHKYVQESYDPDGNRIITTKIIRELNEPNYLENKNKIIRRNQINQVYNSQKFSPSPYASPIMVQDNNFQGSPLISENYEVQNSFDNNFNQSAHFNRGSFGDNEYNYYGNNSKTEKNLGSSVSRGGSSDYKIINQNEQFYNSQSDFIDNQKSYEIRGKYGQNSQNRIIFENDDDYNDYIKQGKIKIYGKNTMKNLNSNIMAKSMRIKKQKNKEYPTSDFQTPDRGNAKNMDFRRVKVNALKSNGPTCDDMKVTKKMRNQINVEESLSKTNPNFKTKFDSARIIQAWWRNIMDRNEVYDIIVKKAIKLQSFIRGYLVRKKVLRYVTLAIYYQSFCDKLQDVLCVHVKNEIMKLLREKSKNKLRDSRKPVDNKNNGKIQSQIILSYKSKNLLKKIILNKSKIFKRIKTKQYFNFWKNYVYPSALKKIVTKKILKDQKLKLISTLRKWKLISNKIKKQIDDTKRYFYKTNSNLSREIRSRSVQKSLRNNFNLSSSLSRSCSPSSYKNIISSHQRNFTLTPSRINDNRPYDLFKSPAGTSHFYGGEACVRFIKNRKYKEIICTTGDDKENENDIMDLATNKKYIKRHQVKRINDNIIQNGKYNNKINKVNNIRVITKNYKTDYNRNDNLRSFNNNNIRNGNYEKTTTRNVRQFNTRRNLNNIGFFSPSYDRKIKYIRIVDKYCPIHGWLCPIHGVKMCPIHGNTNNVNNIEYNRRNIFTRNMARSYNNIYDVNPNLDGNYYDQDNDYYKQTDYNYNYNRIPRTHNRPTNRSVNITFGNRSEFNERMILDRYNRKNSIDNRLAVSIIKLPDKKQKTDNTVKIEDTQIVTDKIRKKRKGKLDTIRREEGEEGEEEGEEGEEGEEEEVEEKKRQRKQKQKTRKNKFQSDKINKKRQKNDEEDEESENSKNKNDKDERLRVQKKPILVDKGINPSIEDNEILKLSQINIYGSKPEMSDEGTQKNDYTSTLNTNVSNETEYNRNYRNNRNNINNNGMSEEDVKKYHLLLKNAEKDHLEKLYNKLYTIVIKKIYKELFNKKNYFDKWKNNILTNKNKDDEKRITLSRLLYKKIMGDKLRLSNAFRKWSNIAHNLSKSAKNKKMSFSFENNQNWKIIEKKPKTDEGTSMPAVPPKITKKENVLNIQVINKKKLKDEGITANFAYRFKLKDFGKTQKSFEIKIKKQKQKSPVFKPSFNENQICLPSQKYIFEKECREGKHHPISEESWRKILRILPRIISKKDNTKSILEKYLRFWLRQTKLLKCCQSAEIIQKFCKRFKRDKISKKWRKLAKKYILKQRLYILKFKKVVDSRKKKLFDLIRITRLNLIFSRRKYLHYILLCWKIYTRNIKQKRKNLKFMYENMLNTYMHMADDIFGSNQKENPSVQDALFEVANSNKFQVYDIKDDVPIAETYYSQKKEETKIDNNNTKMPHLIKKEITQKEIEVKTYQTYRDLLKNHPFSQFKEEIQDDKSLSRRNLKSSSKSPENSDNDNIYTNKKITITKEKKSDDDYYSNSNKKSSNDEQETEKIYKVPNKKGNYNYDSETNKSEKITKNVKTEEEIPVKDTGYRRRKINIEYSQPDNVQQEKKITIEESSSNTNNNKYSRKNKPQNEVIITKKEIVVKEPIKTEVQNTEENKPKKEISIFSRRRRSPQIVDSEKTENIETKVEEKKVYIKKKKEKPEIKEKVEEKDISSGENKAARLYKSRRIKESGSESDRK